MKLSNYTVKFRHKIEKGKTECTIFQEAKHNPDELEVISIGISSVHHTDRYCRKTGRKQSLKKALGGSDINKKERTSIWGDYLS